ncbi:hypothetical protein M0802_006142 [Mischocyttarus mexicanus]|nr:hypothetical protein M0802_006142 [Mischocyttarus mexicanus]
MVMVIVLGAFETRQGWLNRNRDECRACIKLPGKVRNSRKEDDGGRGRYGTCEVGVGIEIGDGAGVGVWVAWMLFDKSAILTVQNHVITRNPRISVSHDDHTTWYLHINNVHQDDKGKYMCQINTAAAKTQYGYLHVVVPPNIDDSQSSSDAIVREGANVTLVCKATGSPTPSIRWKRDDNSRISINRSLSVVEWVGETLEMVRISRLDMGAYLCIASNGVPPTVSKQIKVSVDCK